MTWSVMPNNLRHCYYLIKGLRWLQTRILDIIKNGFFLVQVNVDMRFQLDFLVKLCEFESKEDKFDFATFL